MAKESNDDTTERQVEPEVGRYSRGTSIQLASLAGQLQDFLSRVEAKVDTYRFSIQKQGDEMAIDFALKGSVSTKGESVSHAI